MSCKVICVANVLSACLSHTLTFYLLDKMCSVWPVYGVQYITSFHLGVTAGQYRVVMLRMLPFKRDK